MALAWLEFIRMSLSSTLFAKMGYDFDGEDDFCNHSEKRMIRPLVLLSFSWHPFLV